MISCHRRATYYYLLLHKPRVASKPAQLCNNNQYETSCSLRRGGTCVNGAVLTAALHCDHTVSGLLTLNRKSVPKVINFFTSCLARSLYNSFIIGLRCVTFFSSRSFVGRFLANVNSCSCSLYVVVRPSVCRLSVVCLSVCRL